MTNPNNNGNQIVRLAADAVVFQNRDGSHNVKFNGYAQNNFRSRNGEWGSQRLPFESGYIDPQTDVSKLPFAQARGGDLVAMTTHLEDATYTPAGAQQPEYGVRVVVDDFWFQEPKSVRDARAAEKAAKAAQAQNAQAPVAQPQAAAQPAVAPQAQPVQGVPAWAQEQPATQQPAVAVPQQVAVPAQAQQVTVPAQAQAVAQPAGAPQDQAGGIDDNPPF